MSPCQLNNFINLTPRESKKKVIKLYFRHIVLKLRKITKTFHTISLNKRLLNHKGLLFIQLNIFVLEP